MLLMVQAPALAHHGAKCHDRACVKRVQIHKTHPYCNTWKCVARVTRKQRAREWRWYRTHQHLVHPCIWKGESGENGHPFARFRYSVMNREGSGARGKYQFMPGTYRRWCKYCDWSPLDQEIAAHRLYRAAGTSPWQAC